MSSSLRGHQRIDRRSIALHRAIAAKIQKNPALLDIARDNLHRWSQTNSRSHPYWDASDRMVDLLVEDSERMTTMRQATPFAGVLDPAERWAIYDEFALKKMTRVQLEHIIRAAGTLANVEDVIVGSQAILG